MSEFYEYPLPDTGADGEEVIVIEKGGLTHSVPTSYITPPPVYQALGEISGSVALDAQTNIESYFTASVSTSTLTLSITNPTPNDVMTVVLDITVATECTVTLTDGNPTNPIVLTAFGIHRILWTPYGGGQYLVQTFRMLETDVMWTGTYNDPMTTWDATLWDNTIGDTDYIIEFNNYPEGDDIITKYSVDSSIDFDVNILFDSYITSADSGRNGQMQIRLVDIDNPSNFLYANIASYGKSGWNEAIYSSLGTRSPMAFTMQDDVTINFYRIADTIYLYYNAGTYSGTFSDTVANYPWLNNANLAIRFRMLYSDPNVTVEFKIFDLMDLSITGDITFPAGTPVP